MSIISGIIYSYIGMIISPNVPYWNNRNIHNLGNTGALGNLHAMTAPIMTKFIDRAAYGGRNIREEVYNTFEGDVLDMCCGTGFSTKPGSVGIDTSLEMLRFSKIFNPGSEYLYGNAERFGKDDEFDVVSIMFAFHEMPTSAHQKIIRNAIRVARKKVVVVDISKDYKPSRGMLAGEPYLLNYLDNFEKTIERTPFEYPLYYKTRNKLDGVNKTTLVENHVDMWEYTIKDFDDEEPRDLEDSAPNPYVGGYPLKDVTLTEPISNSEMTRKKFAREMFRLGGGGGWESLQSLDDLTAKRRKKASKRLKEKKRQSIKWEERVENKQKKRWAGKSGVYIYKGDGNYEITPHPLRIEREENERLNKKNNQTKDQGYWENIATNMIDENQRNTDDYSYRNKVKYSMRTNWYYRPDEDDYVYKSY